MLANLKCSELYSRYEEKFRMVEINLDYKRQTWKITTLFSEPVYTAWSIVLTNLLFFWKQNLDVISYLKIFRKYCFRYDTFMFVVD